MVRFAVLGAGNIARRFAGSLAHVRGAELVAASCRTTERAGAFLAKVAHADDARAYGSHEALLADERVDAVYLALPHALHAAWAMRAMRAGKPVLCEKPACLTAAEMAEVAEVARGQGVLFMEAMKPRFQPLYQQVLEAVGEVGPVVRVEASLCNDMLDAIKGAGSYHMTPGPGAGALLDCGTYCASWIEDVCPGVPTPVSLAGAAAGGVDVYVSSLVRKGNVEARLECAFDRAKPRRCTIVGERGRVVVDELHRPTHASVLRADGTGYELDAPYEVDDLHGEISHFVGLVEAGAPESPVMSLADSLHCALILDAARPALEVTPDALAALAEQERLLQYPRRFGDEEAFELGLAIRSLRDDYDLGYVVRIVRERDGYELFRWGADGKRPANYDYAEGKRQAALRLGHCSLWGWTEARLAGASDDDLLSHGDMPVAGAFPIRAAGAWVATVCVSGLHDGLDHELVVRGLGRVLGVRAPAYPCVTV